MVERAFAKIPYRFRRRLANVALIVEPKPSGDQLRGFAPGGTLLGLYRGRPLTTRSVSDSFVMPDQIVIFQGPHERLARNREHLEKLVEETSGTRWLTISGWMKRGCGERSENEAVPG